MSYTYQLDLSCLRKRLDSNDRHVLRFHNSYIGKQLGIVYKLDKNKPNKADT